MRAYLIGCGGIGSWLGPVLAHSIAPESITVIDGDAWEERNLSRCMCSAEDIGMNKARWLAAKLRCQADTRFFSGGLLSLRSGDVLLIAADNHPARLAALQEADRYGLLTIIAANETTSSEAYVYKREWRGTNLDPRTFYPELLTVRTGDPRALEAGCTGLAQQLHPQLASANFMAAALAVHLFAAWTNPSIPTEVQHHLPHRLSACLSAITTHKAEIRKDTHE